MSGEDAIHELALLTNKLHSANGAKLAQSFAFCIAALAVQIGYGLCGISR
jgi:hypothetical protein